MKGQGLTQPGPDVGKFPSSNELRTRPQGLRPNRRLHPAGGQTSAGSEAADCQLVRS